MVRIADDVLLFFHEIKFVVDEVVMLHHSQLDRPELRRALEDVWRKECQEVVLMGHDLPISKGDDGNCLAVCRSRRRRCRRPSPPTAPAAPSQVAAWTVQACKVLEGSGLKVGNDGKKGPHTYDLSNEIET